MADFNIAVEKTITNEGGYVNDPIDRGGATKYGISQRSYSSINIKDLTINQAKDIYLRDFWKPLKCELINYQLLANKLFDMSVLVGIRHAVTNLQMAIYSQGCHDIIVDGIMGEQTLSYVNTGAVERFLKDFLRNMEAYFNGLKNPKYIKGWIKRLYS